MLSNIHKQPAGQRTSLPPATTRKTPGCCLKLRPHRCTPGAMPFHISARGSCQLPTLQKLTCCCCRVVGNVNSQHHEVVLSIKSALDPCKDGKLAKVVLCKPIASEGQHSLQLSHLCSVG